MSFVKQESIVWYPQAESIDESFLSLENLLASQNSSLVIPLNLTQLFGDRGSLWTYQKARASGSEAIEKLFGELTYIDKSCCEAKLKIIEDSLAHLKHLQIHLNKNIYSEELSFRVIASTLQDMQAFVEHFMESKINEVVPMESKKNIKDKLILAEESLNYVAVKQQLKTLSEYMQQTQPHSLLTIGLLRLARWVDMPVNEIINELFLEEQMAVSVAHGLGIPIKNLLQEYAEDDD